MWGREGAALGILKVIGVRIKDGDDPIPLLLRFLRLPPCHIILFEHLLARARGDHLPMIKPESRAEF